MANARPIDDARAIRAGLTEAVRRGVVTSTEADSCRTAVRRAREAIATLPAARAGALGRVLRVVRLQAGAYTHARVTALCGMLGQNRMYLARRGLPPNGTDVTGTDGVVYRAGWGYGLQFHPLANVIKLNAYTYAGQRSKVRQLADALRARAVAKDGRTAWEYYFRYGSGRPPWRSGMVQAIGAQALARSSTLLKDTTLLTAAARAYQGLTGGGLIEALPAGPWVRLYSFSTIAVLNAQLQSALSVADYGRITANADATALGGRLRESARTLLPSFDTGYWSRYALNGAEAPFKYHHYHVELLDFLARRTLDDFWRSAQERFERYSHEPPIFKTAPERPAIYPWPVDGFRDRARIAFWVSKVSTVSVRVGGRTIRLGREPGGWHFVTWSAGPRAPGRYVPTVTAIDLAGNAGRSKLAAVTIKRDTTAPEVKASVSGRRLRWVATDATTPYITLRVRLTRAGKVKVLMLGRRGLRGSLRLALPRGNWQAVLRVADSSGNVTRVPLGTVPTPTS